jgi:hypothetical protein
MQFLVSSPFERPNIPSSKLSEMKFPDIVTPIENTIYPQITVVSGVFIAILATWMMINSFKN